MADAHIARDDEPKVPQSAREWHELALGRCTCPDDQDEADDARDDRPMEPTDCACDECRG